MFVTHNLDTLTTNNTNLILSSGLGILESWILIWKGHNKGNLVQTIGISPFCLHSLMNQSTALVSRYK